MVTTTISKGCEHKGRTKDVSRVFSEKRFLEKVCDLTYFGRRSFIVIYEELSNVNLDE